jgi:pSer/pThr/pTyr-binding forkhead associated (FHA) protein
VEFRVTHAVSGYTRISVQDRGSTTGRRVDGHRITSTALQDGSEVKIGRTTMTVRIEDADEEAGHV